MLWLHIARVRAGQDDKDEINGSLWKLPIDWPWRIVAFYAGLGTPETAMDAGQSGATDIERQSRSCDANFYVGVYQIEKGALAEARELLEAAAKDCPIGYFERAAALMELKRLDGLELSHTQH